MKEITVTVQGKIARQTNNVVYVCGNSDYEIKFTFDEEWSGLETKTARFIWNGQFEEVVFSGDVCPVPVISNTYSFEVGVYAGNLRTTTPAYVSAKKSILCGDNSPREAGTFLVPSALLDKKADKDYVDEEIFSLLNYVNEVIPKGNGGATCFIYFGKTIPEDAPAGSILIDLSKQPSEGGITEETDPTVPAWAKQPQKPTYTAAEVGAATPDDITKALANLPTGGDSPIEEIFRLTTTEEVKIIETGINLNEYAEIWAYCRTLPVEGSTTTRFDWWFVQGMGIGVANSLHNTQRRCHFAHIENLVDERLHVNYGYGTGIDSILYKPSHSGSSGNGTSFHTMEQGHIVNNVNTNFKFGVYLYGNATLEIGTEVLIFGRK